MFKFEIDDMKVATQKTEVKNIFTIGIKKLGTLNLQPAEKYDNIRIL
jgi:hypothetical protein